LSSAINSVLNAENSTIIKTGFGIATLAMFGFIVARFVKNNPFPSK
jgi:hypothetical protein